MPKILTFFVFLFCLNTSLSASESLKRGEALYGQCAGCHGQRAENGAFEKSRPLVELKPEEFIEITNAYRENKTHAAGPETAMSKVIKSLTKQDITDLAEYIWSLRK